MVGNRVGVKFCGGCNPQINRSKLFKELERKLPVKCGIIRDRDQEVWDVGIMLGGCSVACADTDEIRRLARNWIIVSGSMVDLFPLEESQIADAVVEKCRLLLNPV